MPEGIAKTSKTKRSSKKKNKFKMATAKMSSQAQGPLSWQLDRLPTQGAGLDTNIGAGMPGDFCGNWENLVILPEKGEAMDEALKRNGKTPAPSFPDKCPKMLTMGCGFYHDDGH